MAWDDESNKNNDGSGSGSGGESGAGGGHGPWGSRDPGQGPDKPSKKPKNPWDQQRPGGENDVPNLEEVLRQAQEKLGGLFGGRKPPAVSEGKRGLGVLLILGVLLWLATGFYIVNPNDNAALLTFGKWESTRSTPGLGYHIPWPVQSVMTVNVASVRRLEIGVSGADENTNDPSESPMLTGDENIVDVDFVVMWNINNARDYLFNIRDPEATVKNVAESAMSATVGRTQIQTAMTEGRADIEASTKEMMQKMLDDYQSGIVISSVQLLKVNPPSQVVDAFDDVQRARADLERSKNEAETYANGIVPVAKGDAQKLLQDSEAYKEATISKAKGEAGRFTSVYAAYAQAKDVTAKRIYIETMEQIMANSKKVLVGEGKGGAVLPYLALGASGDAKPALAPVPSSTVAPSAAAAQ